MICTCQEIQESKPHTHTLGIQTGSTNALIFESSLGLKNYRVKIPYGLQLSHLYALSRNTRYNIIASSFDIVYVLYVSYMHSMHKY